MAAAASGGDGSSKAENNPKVTFRIDGSGREGRAAGDVGAAPSPCPSSHLRARSLKSSSDQGSETLSGAPSRKPTLLSQLQHAASSVQMQRATSLPVEDDHLRHAATMPTLMDVEGIRPFCFGLWKPRQLVGFLLGVGGLIVFCSVRVIREYSKADAMVAVSCITACFWLGEVMPIYVTALLPVVLMPLLEITSTQIAAAAYWNWVSMLFLGAFMVDVALEHVQLPRRLLLAMLRKTGVTQGWCVLAIFMAIAWLLSMVCNDVAVTLMLAPFATSLLNTAQEAAMDTAAAAVQEEGNSRPAGAEQEDVRNIEDAARPMSRFGTGLLLGIAYAASAGGIATTIGTPANALLAGQQILGGAVYFNDWLGFAFPISAVTVLCAYAVVYFMYARNVQLPVTHEVLIEQDWSFDAAAQAWTSDEILVGVVAMLLVVLLCLQPVIDKFIVNPLGEPLSGSATVTCLCACLLFMLPSTQRRGEALLTWRIAQERVPWGVLLLIGGGFALAQGFRESGLDVVLGHGIGQFVPHASPLALNFVVVFSVVALIQLMNNVATAAWLLPVLSSASVAAVVNPLRLLLPATVACSLSFLLPTASPSNAVIFGKSRELAAPLRIRDFIKTGAPLSLVVATVVALLSHGMAQIVFDVAAPFPRDICETSEIDCIWVFVPGVVEGRHVEEQACIPLDASDDQKCRLWNGKIVNIFEVGASLPFAPPTQQLGGLEHMAGGLPEPAAPQPEAARPAPEPEVQPEPEPQP